MTLQLAQPGVSDEKSCVRSAAANHPRGWLETLKPKDVMNQTTGSVQVDQFLNRRLLFDTVHWISKMWE